MLMKPDRNAIVDTIIGANGDVEQSGDELDDKGALETMATELMGAIDAKDSAAIASIMKNMVSVCKEEAEAPESDMSEIME